MLVLCCDWFFVGNLPLPSQTVAPLCFQLTPRDKGGGGREHWDGYNIDTLQTVVLVLLHVAPVDLSINVKTKGQGLLFPWRGASIEPEKIIRSWTSSVSFFIFDRLILQKMAKLGTNNIFGTIFTWDSQSNSKIHLAYKIQAI